MVALNKSAIDFPRKTYTRRGTAFIKWQNLKIAERLANWCNTAIPVTIETFWGDTMLVIIPEKVSMRLYRDGYFEEGLTRMFLEHVKLGMVVFDIGAHFGYYTLLASKLVQEHGHVHSFEPTSSSFKVLQRNAGDKKNVTLHNCAVYSACKKLIMYDYGIEYSAFNSMYQARLQKKILHTLRPKEHVVNAITIDEFVQNNHVKPDFIKIDAESAEYEILLGMQKTIDTCRPIITLEVGDEHIEGVRESSKLVRFLIQKNYIPYEFTGGKISKHIIRQDAYSYDNLLFLPP